MQLAARFSEAPEHDWGRIIPGSIGWPTQQDLALIARFEANQARRDRPARRADPCVARAHMHTYLIRHRFSCSIHFLPEHPHVPLASHSHPLPPPRPTASTIHCSTSPLTPCTKSCEVVSPPLGLCVWGVGWDGKRWSLIICLWAPYVGQGCSATHCLKKCEADPHRPKHRAQCCPSQHRGSRYLPLQAARRKQPQAWHRCRNRIVESRALRRPKQHPGPRGSTSVRVSTPLPCQGALGTEAVPCQNQWRCCAWPRLSARPSASARARACPKDLSGHQIEGSTQ